MQFTTTSQKEIFCFSFHSSYALTMFLNDILNSTTDDPNVDY